MKRRMLMMFPTNGAAIGISIDAIIYDIAIGVSIYDVCRSRFIHVIVIQHNVFAVHFNLNQMNPTIIPLSSLGMADTELIDSCIWRNIRFYAKMNPHTDVIDGHVLYHCIYGYQKGKDIVINERGFRYSEFLKLYEYLVDKYKLSKALPAFPGKHWWGNTYKSVQTERINAFDKIFRKLNNIMDINNDPLFHEFFNVDTSDRRQPSNVDLRIVNMNRFIIQEYNE